MDFWENCLLKYVYVIISLLDSSMLTLLIFKTNLPLNRVGEMLPKVLFYILTKYNTFILDITAVINRHTLMCIAWNPVSENSYVALGRLFSLSKASFSVWYDTYLLGLLSRLMRTSIKHYFFRTRSLTF